MQPRAVNGYLNPSETACKLQYVSGKEDDERTIRSRS